MVSLPANKLVTGIIVIVVVAAVIYGGYVIIKPLVDSIAGKGEISEREIAKSQDAFSFFIKQYKECKGSPDVDCLCSLHLVIPEGSVLKIENNKLTKETEFRLLKGVVEESKFLQPQYVGKGSLTEIPKEKRIVKGDIPFLLYDITTLPSDYWNLVEKDGKTVLEPNRVEYSQNLFIAPGENCFPCLFSEADIDGFEEKAFDPGFMYKLDKERTLLLGERQRKGYTIVEYDSTLEDLTKLKRCSLVTPEATELFDSLVSAAENCLPFKPSSRDRVSKRILLAVTNPGSEYVAAGMRYKVGKYGAGEWELLGHYLVLTRDVAPEPQTDLRSLPSPSAGAREASDFILGELKGKNSVQGWNLLKESVISVDTDLSGFEEPIDAEDISLIVRTESVPRLRPKVAEATSCALFDLVESTRESKLPASYSMRINKDSFELFRDNNKVTTSNQFPLEFCQLSARDSQGLAISSPISIGQNMARLEFYRYPDDSVCVFPLSLADVEAETTKGIIAAVEDPFKPA